MKKDRNWWKNISELQRVLYAELYRKSFYEFVKEFWDEADPQPFIDGVLVQFYCEYYQYLTRNFLPYKLKLPEITLPKLNKDEILINVRTNKQNGNINIPPRHSKSMVLNVLSGCWLLVNSPAKSAAISHTRGLALQMNEKRQKLLNSEKFKFFFNKITFVKNTSEMLRDDRGAELYSVSRDSLTGYGFDVGVCDDLTNAETARKDKEEMNNAWSFFRNTLPSRANDEFNYVILNIQQRLSPNDITGRIMADLELSKIYDFVVLPAQFEKTTYLVFPISGKIHKFKKGDYLWPERFGDYKKLKIQVGETVWQTQYIQKPQSSNDTVIKEDMINEINLSDTPGIENADIVYLSTDFPIKDKESSDFLGSVLAYRVNKTLYIVDCLEKHLAFKKSVEYIKSVENLYPGSIKICEDKANGSPVIEQLQDEVSGLIAFQPGTASKIQRMESASLYSNNVKFVKTKFNELTNSWTLSESLQNLKNRLLLFPQVLHDDICDAFSMLLLFVFKDKKYQVYGRALTDGNIIQKNEQYEKLYSTIFFNKEGDLWKVLEIAINYKEESELIVKKEYQFKANMNEGFIKLKELFPKNKVFIDCSYENSLEGLYKHNIAIERYEDSDFEKSVTNINLLFASNRIKFCENCKLLQTDLETFKYLKSKDENVKYSTTKDGFIACLRIARLYYGL